MGQTGYYGVVIALSAVNLILAAVAYLQRKKQIQGNRLREDQLRLAQCRNDLAQSRLDRLDDQIGLMTEIRDALRASGLPQPTRGRLRPVLGVIDVGSATMRLTVGRYTTGGWQDLGGNRAFLRLGAELERSGGYPAGVLEDVAAVARGFMESADRAGCEQLAIVVTAPGRMGANPDQLLDTITQATGRSPVLLTAGQEARLTFLGAADGALGRGETAVVCDIGGGSTEISAGSLGGEVDMLGSFAVGSVRLAEQFFLHDPPRPGELEAARAHAASALQITPQPSASVALVTGGTAHAMGKLGEPLLDTDALERAMALVTESAKQMKRFHRHRRHALPAGIVVLECIHRRLAMPLTVAPGGLRQGVLRELDSDRFHDTLELSGRLVAPLIDAPQTQAVG